MKHIISSFILFLCCTGLQAQDRVVEQPAFEVRNTNTLEFQKIILNDTATIMYVDAYYRLMRNSGCRNQVRPLSV